MWSDKWLESFTELTLGNDSSRLAIRRFGLPGFGMSTRCLLQISSTVRKVFGSASVISTMTVLLISPGLLVTDLGLMPVNFSSRRIDAAVSLALDVVWSDMWFTSLGCFAFPRAMRPSVGRARKGLGRSLLMECPLVGCWADVGQVMAVVFLVVFDSDRLSWPRMVGFRVIELWCCGRDTGMVGIWKRKARPLGGLGWSGLAGSFRRRSPLLFRRVIRCGLGWRFDELPGNLFVVAALVSMGRAGLTIVLVSEYVADELASLTRSSSFCSSVFRKRFA